MHLGSGGPSNSIRAIAALMLGSLLALAGCQRPPQGPLPAAGLPGPFVTAAPGELIDQAARQVKNRVTAQASAQALLRDLDAAKARLADGDRAGARRALCRFAQTLDNLVAGGGLSPTVADELRLHAGSSLGAISSPPLCQVVPAGAPVPYFLYSSRIICVERTQADPPLPPDSPEHCTPVADTLQIDILNRALDACRADGYTCAPAEPGSCVPGCVKAAKPGLTAPRLRFFPDTPSCESEPVKKHACVVTGFYECNCACVTEDI